MGLVYYPGSPFAVLDGVWIFLSKPQKKIFLVQIRDLYTLGFHQIIGSWKRPLSCFSSDLFHQQFLLGCFEVQLTKQSGLGF